MQKEKHLRGGGIMSRYEFSLLQEVLLEKGAGVLGDLSRYKRQNGIAERTHPVAILYSLVCSGALLE